MSAGGVRVDGSAYPALMEADRPGMHLEDVLELRDAAEALLHDRGALLLRGFGEPTPQGCMARFGEFVEALSGSALDYHERSSPRHAVGNGVFTATDHPAALEIFPHNEQSYNLAFPARLHFMCLEPPASGGATTLVDSRDVLDRVPDRLRERLARDGYLYVRTLRPYMGLAWQEVFQTDSREAAESYAAENGIELTWLPDDEARTVQRRDTIARHPPTADEAWFNHCAFFHVSTLGPDNAAMMRAEFGEDGLPNQTYFADGEPISDADAELLRAAYTSGLTGVEWRYGDVLVVDNIIASHGRAAYSGARDVIVAMTGLTAWDEVRPPIRARPGSSARSGAAPDAREALSPPPSS